MQNRPVRSGFDHVLCKGKGCDEVIQHDRLPAVHRSMRQYGDGSLRGDIDIALCATEVFKVKGTIAQQGSEWMTL
jgi:hypothetical protein